MTAEQERAAIIELLKANADAWMKEDAGPLARTLAYMLYGFAGSIERGDHHAQQEGE